MEMKFLKEDGSLYQKVSYALGPITSGDHISEEGRKAIMILVSRIEALERKLN